MKGGDADPSPPSTAVVKKGKAIPLLPLWAVRPVQSLSACTRLHFTFTFTFTYVLAACTLSLRSPTLVLTRSNSGFVN